LPNYFVPDGHARVEVICFECHAEQQDVHPRKNSGKQQPSDFDRVRELLSEKTYAAWKLVCVDGLSHQAAAEELGITQQSLSARLARAFSRSAERAVKDSIRLRDSIVRAS
jgi:DNA-directed RNA polymerase specialized sigma24 family protein